MLRMKGEATISFHVANDLEGGDSNSDQPREQESGSGSEEEIYESEIYGDEREKKREGVMRIAFWNIHSFPRKEGYRMD